MVKSWNIYTNIMQTEHVVCMHLGIYVYMLMKRKPLIWNQRVYEKVGSGKWCNYNFTLKKIYSKKLWKIIEWVFNFIYLFLYFGFFLPACISVHHTADATVSQADPLDWSYWWLWAVILMLWIEPGFSGRAASALNHRTISSVFQRVFLSMKLKKYTENLGHQ